MISKTSLRKENQPFPQSQIRYLRIDIWSKNLVAESEAKDGGN